MTDNSIIEEAIRLVDEGVSVTLPVEGRSMLPFIVGGRDSVVLEKVSNVSRHVPTASRRLRKGDVVLAWVEGRRYVVHRIIAIDGDRVTLMGDGNLAGTERCDIGDVKALVTGVVDDLGRARSLYKRWRLWLWLRPIRRYLLAIYRRI